MYTKVFYISILWEYMKSILIVFLKTYGNMMTINCWKNN